MQSKAATVDDYLASLPPERRDIVQTLRETVLEHLPTGYEEGMQYGMIGYYVPLSRYPDTYNGQALAYAGLASQKNYVSLYLMGVYADPEAEAAFKQGFADRGLKLNMGKSCVRFKKLEDIPLDLIGEAVGRMSVDEFIPRYEAIHSRS